MVKHSVGLGGLLRLRPLVSLMTRRVRMARMMVVMVIIAVILKMFAGTGRSVVVVRRKRMIQKNRRKR